VVSRQDEGLVEASDGQGETELTLSELLIDTVDILGRSVLLTRRQWEVHVLSNKAWMDEFLHHVELAIESPTLINHDREFPDRECFYLVGHKHFEGDVMKVVIRYNYDEHGFVITAYLQRNKNADEVRKWPT